MFVSGTARSEIVCTNSQMRRTRYSHLQPAFYKKISGETVLMFDQTNLVDESDETEQVNLETYEEREGAYPLNIGVPTGPMKFEIVYTAIGLRK